MVRFETREYVRSHGKEPRGTGSWGFCFDGDNAVWFAPIAQTFTQAKVAARQEAKRRNSSVARVQP